MAPVHVDLNNEPYPAPFSVGPLQLVEKSSLNILNLVRFKVALEAITKPYFSQCNFCSLQDVMMHILGYTKSQSFWHLRHSYGQFYACSIYNCYLQLLRRGCGSICRAVASNSRGPWFESSHRQKIILNIYLLSTVLKRRK